tara:strand:+ start:59 stop:319 length:261 start_codon:yes stop_codon:yes gene_type:complete
MKSDNTKNQIVLPIKGNKYVSIIQNAKDEGWIKLGSSYGNYGDKVEIAILDSNFEYIDDGTFDYGVKGYLTTQELAKELLNLTIGD